MINHSLSTSILSQHPSRLNERGRTRYKVGNSFTTPVIYLLDSFTLFRSLDTQIHLASPSSEGCRPHSMTLMVFRRAYELGQVGNVRGDSWCGGPARCARRRAIIGSPPFPLPSQLPTNSNIENTLGYAPLSHAPRRPSSHARAIRRSTAIAFYYRFMSLPPSLQKRAGGGFPPPPPPLRDSLRILMVLPLPHH